MRAESSVTAISWIPSEAIEGMTKFPFEMGLVRYDEPPPDKIGDIDRLREQHPFRFANHLKAWIEVEDGRVIDYGHTGKGVVGVTKVRFGPREAGFPGIGLPVLRPAPEVSKTSIRFAQTVGGRTALPAPRRIKDNPFFQLSSPIAWTTLSLTINADGSSHHEMTGASSFPRHWVYDRNGKLSHKSGIIDFYTWYQEAHERHTPWGDEESPALVTQVETALERELSYSLMHANQKPEMRRLDPGMTLVAQGEAGEDLFLVLDGILAVEVDGNPAGEYGPGSILGERASLEGGTRKATLRAKTKCRVAVGSPRQFSTEALEEVAVRHR